MYIPHSDTRTLHSDLHGRLTKSNFSLNTSGVASLFGGNVAVAAMTTLHLNPTRKWLGWYNSPGTYDVARHYSQFCNSRLLDALFPGAPTDLATPFVLDKMKGGKYIGARNGTVLDTTGPFCSILMKDCRHMTQPVYRVEGRVSQPVEVTISELVHSMDPNLLLRRTTVYSPLVAALPILVSFGTAALCATVGDWICFSIIVLGILVNGVSCLVFGSAQFKVDYHVSSVDNSGDGILVSKKDKQFVVLKGSEVAVNSITHEAFTFAFKSKPKGCKDIKWCSIFLVLQVVVQLLLIPLGTLFGQIMFISSLTASWVYNLWLSSRVSFRGSSRNRGNIWTRAFTTDVLQGSTKFIFGTRTTAVLFMLLVLQPNEHAKIMDMLIPNDTAGWRKFKGHVLSQIGNSQGFCFDDSWWNDPIVAADKKLLDLLCQDAEAAYQG